MTTLATYALWVVGRVFCALVEEVSAVAAQRPRPAWQGTDRRSRLPSNWAELRAEADRLNPRRICHWCGEPAGSDLDHKQRGDHICQAPGRHVRKCQCNLDWIHSRRDFDAGVSRRNCHGEKTGAEGAAARPQYWKEPEHPALR